jgi:two-component system response regulator YesN
VLKILLVDDEIVIRKGLSKAISRDKDFIVIGEVSDGIEAMNLIDKQIPDVVITDIRMPNMNGTELVGQLSQKYPDIKKIVLSGYEDFEYVRESMRNGAADYLLKPVDDNKLHDLLENIQLEIMAERKNKEERIDKNIKLNESLGFLRDQYLNPVITNPSIKVDTQIYNKLSYYGINVDSSDKFSIMFISVDNYKKLCAEQGEEEGKIQYFIIRNISEEIVGDENEYFSCQTELGLAIFIKTENDDIIRQVADSIYKNLKKYTQIRFTVVLSAVAEDIMNINLLYRDACLLLQHRYYNIGSSIIVIDKSDNLHIWNTNIELIISDFEKRLENCIELTRLNDVNSIFCYLADYAKTKYISAKVINQLLSDVCAKMKFKSSDFKRAVGELFTDEYSYFKELEMIDTFDGIQKLSVDFYTAVITQIISIRSKKDKKIIQVVKDYISEHYNEDIPLSKISEIAFVNSNYFCDLFKNITGETFIDYLTRYRIDKAKILLKDVSVKTYEVGIMVGYDDPNYFSKVFKKVVGISPSQYRNIVL